MVELMERNKQRNEINREERTKDDSSHFVKLFETRVTSAPTFLYFWNHSLVKIHSKQMDTRRRPSGGIRATRLESTRVNFSYHNRRVLLSC